MPNSQLRFFDAKASQSRAPRILLITNSSLLASPAPMGPLKRCVRVFIRLLIQRVAHSANGFRVTGLLLACSFLFEPIWPLPCSAARASLVANYVSFRGDVRRASSTPRNLPDQENGKFSRLFGLDTEPVARGTLLEKWHRVKAEIAHDLEVVEQCRANGPCPVPAQKLIDLASEGASRTGRARVGLINRAVNSPSLPSATRLNGAFRTVGAVRWKRFDPNGGTARITRFSNMSHYWKQVFQKRI